MLQDSIKNSDDHFASILKDHYILGKRLIRIDLTSDGGYHITDTTKDVVYVKVGATTKEQRRDCWQWLVNNKEIPYIEHVESRSDPDAKKHSYTYDKETGILCIHVAPIQPQIKDNDLIDDYLQATFGRYKPFIKQYMAAYAFTNFRQLPTLICYGQRGTSKSTFAEIVSMMFPRLYCD